MHWITPFLSIALSALLCCEYIADYVKLGQCTWPKLKHDDSLREETDAEGLRAMILADPHLLGPIRGHWLDKFYREWHMHRAFQAAMTLLRPNVVFVLGDLFDEGDYVNKKEFKEYVQRFHRHFHTPKGTSLVSAVGNHDIGFHYRMWLYPRLVKRFERHFNNTGVRLYTFKGIHFVLINSMAMENDGCQLCEAALRELNDVSAKLRCLQHADNCTDLQVIQQHQHYSRPIVLQHFPTYRSSDRVCQEHDAPTNEEPYREHWEVLSKTATDLIGQLLQPRLAFAGHSHHYCLSINRWGVREYTVASFSWRNKENPSFLLASLTNNSASVVKCNMLPQQTVYTIYSVTIALLLLLLLRQVWQVYYKRMHLKPQSKQN